jgi:hypothetical protein
MIPIFFNFFNFDPDNIGTILQSEKIYRDHFAFPTSYSTLSRSKPAIWERMVYLIGPYGYEYDK